LQNFFLVKLYFLRSPTFLVQRSLQTYRDRQALNGE
jgi:hypothetical protein